MSGAKGRVRWLTPKEVRERYPRAARACRLSGMESFTRHLGGSKSPTTFTLGDAYGVPSQGWLVYTYTLDPPAPAGLLRAMKGETFPAPGGEDTIEGVETFAVADVTPTAKVGLAVRRRLKPGDIAGQTWPENGAVMDDGSGSTR